MLTREMKELKVKAFVGDDFRVVNANDIELPAAITEDKDIWTWHDKRKYMNYIQNIERIYDLLDPSKHLMEVVMELRKTDKDLANVMQNTLSIQHALPVQVTPDGRIQFSYDGRHRILAARELNADIPVRVVS